MKKKQTKIIVAVVSVLIILGIGLGVKKHMDDKAFKEEMIKIATSNEAKKVYKKGLKNIDKNAFTLNGIIKNYEVDLKEIEHNPMGGINGRLIINNDNELYVLFILNNTDGQLKAGGFSECNKLHDLIVNKED